MGRLAIERLLAGFQNIDDEAEETTSESWHRLMSQPATGDEDPADAAAEAWDDGVERYTAITNLHQAVLNLLATKIRHLFEQHVNDYDETAQHHGQTPLTWARLGELPSWPVVDELRLVANTAKHGEGDSATQLRTIRPDLFENPIFKKMGYADPWPNARAPFAGDGLFVARDDIERYQAAVESFWTELAERHTPGRRSV